MVRLFKLNRHVGSCIILRYVDAVFYRSYSSKMGGDNSKFSAKRAREAADNHKSKWRGAGDLSWDYSRDRGPEKWWMYFPKANSDQQSPIDIVPEEAEFDSNLITYPLQITTPTDDSLKMTMTNTGLTWQVHVRDKNSYVTGGPAERQKYFLEQFHMHWGESNHCGSEHTIHGKALSAELHIVYWNSTYTSFTEAVDKPDGLLVMAVLLKLDTAVDRRSEQMLDVLTHCCDTVTFKGQTVDIPTPFNIKQLMPGDTHKYWVYKGSLTTPPCYESVTWIVFHQPMPVTVTQLERCRNLRNHTSGEPCIQFGDIHTDRVLNNVRPVQPRGSRVIRTADKLFTEHTEFTEQFHEQPLGSSRSDSDSQFERHGFVKPKITPSTSTSNDEF